MNFKQATTQILILSVIQKGLYRRLTVYSTGIFQRSVFTFQFLKSKIHNYVLFYSILNCIIQKIYKLSKTNLFFSHFEGTRGEKTQLFRTPDLVNLLSQHSSTMQNHNNSSSSQKPSNKKTEADVVKAASAVVAVGTVL